MTMVGQVRLHSRNTPRMLLGDRRSALGQSGSCCVRTNPDGTQQIICTDPPWVSSPGIYPGYPDCGVVPSGAPPSGTGLPTPTPQPTSPPQPVPSSPRNVIACPTGNGQYALVDLATGSVVAQGVDPSSFAQYGAVSQAPDSCGEPACAPFCQGGGGTSPPTAPAPSGPLPTQQIPGLPPIGLPPASLPTQGQLPTEPPGPQVLPAPQNQSYETIPTGAWPGSPFGGQTSPPSPVRVVPQQAPPMPFVPPPCPTGPVPLRMWAEGCAASKF